MTKTIRLVSNVIIVSLLAVGFYGCTDSEQQAQIDRQKRSAQREAQEQANKAAQAPAVVVVEASATPEPPQTTEVPAEPNKATHKHFTSTTERVAIDCDSEPEVTPCGISFSDCDEHHASYYCQMGVKAWQTTEN
jgi:hypothetical protein